MKGAAEEAATIEGCQLWAKAGPSKSKREHCRKERPLLGDCKQRLPSRAGIALAKDADVSLHAAPKTNVADDGVLRSEPSTSMADELSRLIRKLHMPHQSLTARTISARIAQTQFAAKRKELYKLQPGQASKSVVTTENVLRAQHLAS